MTDEVDVLRRWASEARREGRARQAVVLLSEALAAGADDWTLWHDLGLALSAEGRPADAAVAHEQAIARGGGVRPESWVNLGNALRSSARKERAIDGYVAALALDPRLAAAYYNLHAVLYDDADPSAAELALEQAFALRPDHVETRFFLGALRALHRRPGSGLLAALPAECGFLVEGLRFVQGVRRPGVRLFADTFDTLRFAIARAPAAGLVVELGVRWGTTLRYLAAACPEATVHGFDSFEGLPVGWGPAGPGLYSTEGRAPEVPDNARLHRGWFCDTIEPMLAQTQGSIRLVHVDCDVYASTAEALERLAPRLVGGSILVFDEYLGNPGWQSEEHQAWCEVARYHELPFEYLAFSLFTKQAVVRVLGESRQ